MMKPKDVAKALGLGLSKVYDMCNGTNGVIELPHHRFGRAIRVEEHVVEALKKRTRVEDTERLTEIQKAQHAAR